MKKEIRKLITKISTNKLLKNFFVIFTGQGISSVFGLLSTLLIVSGIGSEKHGVLTVVQTYATLFYSLFSFKTFQALIKYLAKARKDNNVYEIKLYIKWSLVLDVGSLLFMFLTGVLLRDFVIDVMEWPQEMKKYVIIYLATQLFYIQGTTIGILRSYEKYNYVVKSLIISNAIRFFGYLFCFILNNTFLAYYITEIISVLINYILLIFYTYKILKEEKLLDFYKVKLKYKKDFFMFNIYSNLTSTLDLPINQITQLLINKYLGFSANSAYKIFEMLGTVINKLGDPINQIVYPEMNLKIVNKEYDSAHKLSLKLRKMMTILFFLVTIATLLTYRFWFHYFIPEADNYIMIFILYLGFICFVNAAMGTHNLFMALGYVKYNIPILIVINILYLIFLFYAIQLIGLAGVIIAYFLQALGVVIIKEIILKKNKYLEYYDS